MSTAAYAAFFLNTPSSVVHLETIELSHPSFSKTYWIVRNAMNGLTATLEDGTVQTFDYYPLGISASGATDNLDQVMTLTFGDLGMVLPQELDLCLSGAFMMTRPLVKYRVFRSDDLSAPIEGPFTYQLKPIASKKTSSTLTAGAPSLNLNQTGEAYRLDRFPMLRGSH